MVSKKQQPVRPVKPVYLNSILRKRRVSYEWVLIKTFVDGILLCQKLSRIGLYRIKLTRG